MVLIVPCNTTRKPVLEKNEIMIFCRINKSFAVRSPVETIAMYNRHNLPSEQRERQREEKK